MCRRGAARLFLCVTWRTQSLICSYCDRGQIYCAGDCAARATRCVLPDDHSQTNRRGGSRVPIVRVVIG